MRHRGFGLFSLKPFGTQSQKVDRSENISTTSGNSETYRVMNGESQGRLGAMRRLPASITFAQNELRKVLECRWFGLGIGSKPLWEAWPFNGGCLVKYLAGGLGAEPDRPLGSTTTVPRYNGPPGTVTKGATCFST